MWYVYLMEYYLAMKKNVILLFKKTWDLPGGRGDKNPPVNEGDTGLIPSLGRFHMVWSN